MTGSLGLCICLCLCLSIYVFVYAVKSDCGAPSIGDEDSSSEGQLSQEEHCQAEQGGAVSQLPPTGGAHIHTSPVQLKVWATPIFPIDQPWASSIQLNRPALGDLEMGVR